MRSRTASLAAVPAGIRSISRGEAVRKVVVARQYFPGTPENFESECAVESGREKQKPGLVPGFFSA